MSDTICRECDNAPGETGWCTTCSEFNEQQRSLALIAESKDKESHCSVRWVLDRLVERIKT